MNDNTCLLCGESLVLRWTDFHNVARCATCGLPYKIDLNNGTPPEPTPLPHMMQFLRRFRKETGLKVFAGNQRILASDLTPEERHDAEAFSKWIEAHGDELDKALAQGGR